METHKINIHRQINLKKDYPRNIKLWLIFIFSPPFFHLCTKNFLLQKVECHFKI